MPSVSITWHTLKDGHKICPVCLAIDNYTWVFTDEIPDTLIHPVYGEVWNTAQGSAVHERGLANGPCRCHVEPKFSLKDLEDLVRKLRDELKAEYEGTELEEPPDTKQGSFRTTTPEDIGIDLSKYGIE